MRFILIGTLVVLTCISLTSCLDKGDSNLSQRDLLVDNYISVDGYKVPLTAAGVTRISPDMYITIMGEEDCMIYFDLFTSMDTLGSKRTLDYDSLDRSETFNGTFNISTVGPLGSTFHFISGEMSTREIDSNFAKITYEGEAINDDDSLLYDVLIDYEFWVVE